MKEEINIENYEAYYVDYLEGSLSEDMRAAFENFLANNPELEIADELIALSPVQEPMDAFEKALMKKDFGTITNDNIEVAIIAHLESQLSPKETSELFAKIASNTDYQKLHVAYGAAFLQPNKQDTMDKTGLYQKERAVVFAPWLYRAAAVAAILLVALVLFRISTETPQATQEQVADTGGVKPIQPQKIQTDFKQTTADRTQTKQFVQPVGTKNKETKPARFTQPKEIETPTQENQDEQHDAPKPTMRPTLLPNLNEQKAVAITVAEDSKKEKNQDVAMARPQNEGQTPLEFLKEKVVSKINAPVELKTSKGNEREKAGFFLRLGKLEISHKKGGK